MQRAWVGAGVAPGIGVNAYRALTRDASLVAGGGACETELTRRLLKVADECADVHQYAASHPAGDGEEGGGTGGCGG